MPEASQSPVAGIDLGGTKILAGVVDAENRILGRAKRPTPSREGGAAIVRAISDGLEEALGEAGVAAEDLAGIGVGSPGPLDSGRGVILFSANLAVKDFPIGPELEARWGRPVVVWNDVRVGGYGEFHLGAGRGHRNVLAAFVGTGIGGCLIIDGKVVEGATGNAGEIGHIPVRKKGPVCGCGRRGCLETLASRTAIAARIRKAVRKGAASDVASALVDRPGDRIKSKELAAAFSSGDGLVVREVHRAAEALGRGLGGLVNVLEPEVVILGGGVAEALGQPYLEAVRSAAHEQMLAGADARIRFVLAELGDDAGVLGAALLARQRFAPSEAGAAQRGSV
jgi:glucokinase